MIDATRRLLATAPRKGGGPGCLHRAARGAGVPRSASA